MIIYHNLQAINSLNSLNATTTDQAKSMEKLSSGLRINRAGDDAAGLAISEKMRAQIRGLDQAARNAQDGISLIQTAEGALEETTEILQRMRELAIQAANETNATSDQEALKAEVEQLIEEIDRIAQTTEFNTKKILNGSFSSIKLQVGANEGQTISFTIDDMQASTLGVKSMADYYTANQSVAIEEINDAIITVSSARADLGAIQNRLEHTINNLNTAEENLQASESRIRDVDMAEEMMEYTRTNILQQAAQAMLAQANQTPQNVLQLLR